MLVLFTAALCRMGSVDAISGSKLSGVLRGALMVFGSPLSPEAIERAILKEPPILSPTSTLLGSSDPVMQEAKK